MVVEPKETEKEDTELLEPVAIIYETERLVQFTEGREYFVAITDKLIKYIDSQVIQLWEKNEKSGDWGLIKQYFHQCGVPPCFRAGGRVTGPIYPYYYESFIGGVLPYWNRVVTLSSDLDANYIAHLYMERWEYATDCLTCEGSGFVDKKFELPGDTITTKVQCGNCKGSGSLSRGPFGVLQVRPDALRS